MSAAVRDGPPPPPALFDDPAPKPHDTDDDDDDAPPSNIPAGATVGYLGAVTAVITAMVLGGLAVAYPALYCSSLAMAEGGGGDPLAVAGCTSLVVGVVAGAVGALACGPFSAVGVTAGAVAAVRSVDDLVAVGGTLPAFAIAAAALAFMSLGYMVAASGADSQVDDTSAYVAGAGLALLGVGLALLAGPAGIAGTYAATSLVVPRDVAADAGLALATRGSDAMAF